MARTTRPLTNTEVKQARAKNKEYNLADGGGLALRIKPNGSKLWVFNYSRPHTKRRANISFGLYPDLTLAEARKKRDSARELLAKDIDPKEQRDREKSQNQEAHSNTLEHVAANWLGVKQTEVTPNYAEDIWRSLQLHVFPTLGKLPIHKVTAPKTIEAIKPIAAKGNLETIRRLCQRLNEVMTYAVNTGLLEANPLSGIKKAFQSPEKRHMPALKPAELPELMATIREASIKRTTRRLIEWQLHTMSRPSEAAGTRWDEIDFDSAQWTIPAERMKKGRSHTIPLTRQALEILEAMRPISSHREYVFTGDRNYTQSINEQTANMALKRMGFGGRTVAHGLRALASTTLNEQGFDPDVIEAALAHVDSNEVRRAYNRAEYLERRRVMLNWWSEHIDKSTKGDFKPAIGTTTLRAII